MANSHYKVVFLGEGRVGKTSIGKRWEEERFDQSQRSTVAAACYKKSMNIEGKLITINLWDTAGQEEYHSLAPIYYKDAHAALLVFSVIDQKSFDRMVQWKKELFMSRGEDIKIVVVGNKIDMVKERCISAQQAERFAQSIHAKYFEVSAKTGQGIDMLFLHVGSLLVKLQPKGPASRAGKSKIGLQVIDATENDTTDDKKGCC
ncbi:small GTP-binding protein [Tritrichomonas foetus]|uniref:Small GTP-binding protein n=1 Tax=Tritrichomonas foetus TaxID=1144522 RepID=A0A1J4JS78_9EUKA|nr:small GTP-binding protein [Tritrichomonas foetus]|eukprot:OHT00101.1 small GTP-binding protein [Tritrichomonas foetus]